MYCYYENGLLVVASSSWVTIVTLLIAVAQQSTWQQRDDTLYECGFWFFVTSLIIRLYGGVYSWSYCRGDHEGLQIDGQTTATEFFMICDREVGKRNWCQLSGCFLTICLYILQVTIVGACIPLGRLVDVVLLIPLNLVCSGRYPRPGTDDEKDFLETQTKHIGRYFHSTAALITGCRWLALVLWKYKLNIDTSEEELTWDVAAVVTIFAMLEELTQNCGGILMGVAVLQYGNGNSDDGGRFLRDMAVVALTMSALAIATETTFLFLQYYQLKTGRRKAFDTCTKVRTSVLEEESK